MTGNEKKPFDEAEETLDESSRTEAVEADDETAPAGNAEGGSEASPFASEGTAGETGGDPDERLDAAEREVARHKEAMLRMQAEMENLRKRLLRDLERSRKFALERIMKDLLQVRDSLERSQEVSGEAATVEAMKQGQELTLKMLDKVLLDHDLEVIDPAGEAFDPDWHEAMTVQPAEDREEGEVMEVLQKGFRLHDRLIRPARVIVSRKP